MAYVIDQWNCSGCHRCRMECPMDAIRFRNAKYWIDPEKCVSCGSCATVCHNGAISDPDAPAEAAVPHDPMDITCDICVIGGGAAGLAAAAKAQDSGAKVLILEKNHEIGGSAWYATGFRVHYSTYHQEAGLPDNRSAEYDRFMKKTEGKVNGQLLSRLFAANADFIDWLRESGAMEPDYVFDPEAMGMSGKGNFVQKTFVPWNDRRIDGMIGPGGGGWLMTTKLLDLFLRRGGKIFYNTPAKHLITDASGAVIGVEAEDAGGTVRVHCKAVIVAAGAFTRNREIMDKMQPLFYDDKDKEPIHIFTCSTCTGDGLTMCQEIDADIDYVNRRVNMFGPMRHPYPGVSLNIGNGPCFQTDGKYYPGGVDNQEVSNLCFAPHRMIWKIVDEGNAVRSITEKIEAGPDLFGIDLGHFLKNWREVLRQEAEDHAVVIADTLEELADQLGYDRDRFLRDIEAYNASLTPPKEDGGPFIPGTASGPDGEGGMVPQLGAAPMPLELHHGPYYAIRLTLFHENAMGGMTIDEKTRVLRNGTPIPGLYAVGDNTRGIMLPGDIGVRYIEAVFTALTYALNSGYIAGEEAAQYQKS